MSVYIDFNAQDKKDNGSFKLSLLKKNGPREGSGYLVALEDYTVNNVPGYGHLGRGDMTPEKKNAAVKGDLDTFIAKNSWGKNRTDRGMVDGYTAFYRDYLLGDSKYPEFLQGFILPAGF
jgi:hypothetical protein